jgi:hypothetical protein
MYFKQQSNWRLSNKLLRWGLLLSLMSTIELSVIVQAQWISRDHRWQPRGSWNWALPNELPQLYREFNGIDFGHAHLAETLIRTQDQGKVERARLEVLDFIFSSPSVPPDEEQVAPTLTQMVWEAQKTFNWAHIFHRSLYDLFSSDETKNKEEVYRKLLANYLEKPEAITLNPLDHHGKLSSFPESEAFRKKFSKFNTQIWAYHWLQAAAYDVQFMGNAERQRELMPRIIEHYHGYLRNPPLEWQFMPMMMEAAPEFTKRFPEAAAIFDNLHMLHDNVDDILSRPDLYPKRDSQRDAILKVLDIYLHRNHYPVHKYQEYHMQMGKMKMDHEGHSEKEQHEHKQTKTAGHQKIHKQRQSEPAPHARLDGTLPGHSQDMGSTKTKHETGHHSAHKNSQKMMKGMGPRPPSAAEVLSRKGKREEARKPVKASKSKSKEPTDKHETH